MFPLVLLQRPDIQSQLKDSAANPPGLRLQYWSGQDVVRTVDTIRPIKLRLRSNPLPEG